MSQNLRVTNGWGAVSLKQDQADAIVVIPDGLKVNWTSEPTRKLESIYFTADGSGDDRSDLANACKAIQPPYPVYVDGGGPLPGSAASGEKIYYGSQDPKQFPNPNIVLMSTTHPYFAGQVAPTPPPVTSHPTPPSTVTPPLPVPPGGTGVMHANKTLDWPATQDLWDFSMQGTDSQPFDFVVGGTKPTATLKVNEYPGGPIMRKLILWDDAGTCIYGADPNEPLGVHPDVSIAVNAPAVAGGISVVRGQKYRGVIENHGVAGGPGSCRLEILTF